MRTSCHFTWKLCYKNKKKKNVLAKPYITFRLFFLIMWLNKIYIVIVKAVVASTYLREFIYLLILMNSFFFSFGFLLYVNCECWTVKLTVRNAWRHMVVCNQWNEGSFEVLFLWISALYDFRLIIINK